MKPKYEKPVSRELGLSLPNAVGNCGTGGNASTSNSSGANCSNGDIADGNCKQYGGTAGGPNCNTGIIALSNNCSPAGSGVA